MTRIKINKKKNLLNNIQLPRKINDPVVMTRVKKIKNQHDKVAALTLEIKRLLNER